MKPFVIAAAQSGSIKGDIAENIRRHAELVRLASRHGVDVIVFPELSLTGYEASVAVACALTPEDDRLRPLGRLAEQCRITIIAGCPIANGDEKPFIGALIFGPWGSAEVYRKRYLDIDEVGDFSQSTDATVCQVRGRSIGVAICADISHPEHPADARSNGATIYAVGSLITPRGMAAAAMRMADYARNHGMLTIIANHAWASGGLETAGGSAAWNESGERLAQAGPDGQCLVLAESGPAGWSGVVVPA